MSDDKKRMKWRDVVAYVIGYSMICLIPAMTWKQAIAAIVGTIVFYRLLYKGVVS